MSGLSFLPYSSGANAIVHMALYQETIPLWRYDFIAVNSLAYFFLGMGFYTLFERHAMRLNLLSDS